MTDAILDKLKLEGDITDYSYTKKYEEPGVEMRTSEELVITFPSGKVLRINTFSSGYKENVNLYMEDQ